MPSKNNAHRYYLKRQREALAMSHAATEPSVRKIHVELAKRYAEMAEAAAPQSVTVLDPSTVVILDQMAAATRSAS